MDVPGCDFFPIYILASFSFVNLQQANHTGIMTLELVLFLWSLHYARITAENTSVECFRAACYYRTVLEGLSCCFTFACRFCFIKVL